MTFNSQDFESYVPVYDAIPESWEEARPFIVEQFKKVSNAINVREIGFFLEEELLSGKQFVPTLAMSGINSSNSQQFRSVFRMVVDCSPLIVGANSFAHNVTVDSRFTLIDSWVSATDSTGLTSITMVYPEVDIDATNININSPAAYDRAFAVMEYMQEV